MANQIKFDVGFNVDKTGLNQLASSLKNIQKEVQKASTNGTLSKELEQAGTAAKQLEEILNQSWNNKLGQLNLSAFDKSIKSTYGSVQNMKVELEKAGPAGAKAFNQIASSVLNTNHQLRKSNEALDKMFQSIKNVFTYNISSSIFNRLTGTIEQAYGYAKRLDSSLNDIRIVTDKSADDMERFAKQANAASKSLGASTLDYTNASLIYYQQGLSDEEVAARAETTIKAANVTGQTGEEVSEQLTAVWNGYKVTAEETEAYVDKLAAVAATTAADLEELSVGMSKVASAANAMGVDFDDLNAQIATIVSVTRQAPESVGTALKTIYARLGDLKVDGVDEFGVSLGEVSGQLQKMGIQVLDQQGNLRNMTDVIAEVATKWDGWTEAQRQAAAVAMAGKRQYNNLIALFDNWDKYTDALVTSQNALGTLQKQEDVYMESTEAHLKQLSTEAEKTYDILFDTDTANGFIDVLGDLLGEFNDLIGGMSGGVAVITRVGALLVNLFNKQLGSNINQAANNLQSLWAQFKNGKTQLEFINALANDQVKASYAEQGIGSQYKSNSQAVQVEAKMRADMLKVSKQLTQEEYTQLATNQKKAGELERQIEEYESYKDVFNKQFGEAEVAQEKLDTWYNDQLKDIKALEVEYQKVRNAIDDINDPESGIPLIEDIDTVKDQINALLSNENLSLERQTQLKTVLNQLDEVSGNNVKSATIIEENREVILNAQNEIIRKQKQLYDEVYQAGEKQVAVESGKTEELREQSEEIQRQSKSITDNAERAQKISSIISKASGGIEIASSLIGALKTGMDETATGADKANALFAGFSGSLAGAANMLWPGSGFLVQGVLSIGKGILEITGLWDDFEDSLKSTDEKIQEMNEHMQKLASNSQIYRSGKKELEEIAKEYEELSEKAGDYDSTIENLTSIERDRYNELKDIILKYNQDALIGYNDRGEAILQENEGIQDTIDLLKEKYELEVQSYYNGEDFEKDTKTLGQKYKDARNEYQNTLATFEQTGSKEGQTVTYSQITEGLNLGRLQGEIEDTETLAEIQSIFSKGVENVIENHQELYTKFNKLAEENKNNKDIQNTILQWQKDIESISEGLEDAKRIAEEKFKKDSKIQVSPVLNAVKNMSQYKDTYSDLADIAEEAGIKDIDTYIINYISGLDLGAYNGDYNKVYEAVNEFNKNILEAFTNNPKLIEELSKEAEEFGKQSFDSYKEYYEALQAKINELAQDSSFQQLDPETQKNILQSIFGLSGIEIEDGSFIPEDKLYSGMQKIKDSINKLWNTNETDDTIGSLFNPENESDINFILENLEKAAEKTNNWRDAVELVNNQLRISQELSHLTSNISTAGDAINTLMSGKDLSADQIAGLQSLEEEYSELATIQDRQSTAYLNKLLEIREALEQEQIELQKLKETELIDETQELAVKVETEGGEENLQNLQDKLLEVCDADYDILVNVKADIQDDFDYVVADMENISNMASKIGDDFKVAASDIEELGNAFPGILEGMTILKDGTVQLNQEMVETSIQAANAEVTADTNATIEKLQNKEKELEAKRDAAQKIADNASKLASQETGIEKDKSQLIGEINTALNTLKSDNSEETARQEQEDSSNVADAGVESAEIIDKANAVALQNLAQNYADAANTGIQGFEAVTEAAQGGHPGLISAPSISSTSVPKGTVTKKESNKAQLNQGDDFNNYSAEKWKQIAETYQAEANAYEKARQNTENKIAELKARQAKTNKELDNISKGTGSDGKKSGSGGSKGGKGGKGSTEKAPKETTPKEEKEKTISQKEEKKLDEEFDRYWKIKKAIDAVELSLKRLEKQQKQTYGWELINSLKQENKLLDEQTKQYKKLAKAQKQEAAEIRSQLSTMGVTFDKQGKITNYAKATASALDTYNNAIKQYNTGALDDEALKVTEKSYENFKKLLEKYDNLYYKEMEETADKLDDIWREKLANNLKAWETEIQIKIDWQDLKRGWNDFLKELNTDFKKVFKDLRVEAQNMRKNASTYTDANGGTIPTRIQEAKDVEAEIDKIMAGGKSDKFASLSEAQEKLKEINKNLQDDAIALKDLYESAWDNYLDGIDQVDDKLQLIQTRYENINDELSFQKQLIELLYGDKAFELRDTYFKAQERVNESQVNTLKDQVELWERLFRESGANLENMADWSKDQQKYYEKWQTAQKSLNALVVEQIKLLREDYLNTVSQVIDNLDKSLTGGKGIKNVREEWERISQEAEKYYDDTEKAYQIQTYANKLNKGIAEQTGVKNQQKLAALRDKELADLREKKKLTEYDIQAANARYEIALKEIALEDAQNNKTSMKLTRNEEGNWTYQYVADEEDISTKQQDLLDAYNNLYQLASDAYEKNLSTMIELEETYLEKVKEISEDMELTDEEREAKLKELAENFKQDMETLANENATYRRDLTEASAGTIIEIYRQNENAYNDMTDAQRKLVDTVTKEGIKDFEELRDKAKEDLNGIDATSKELMSSTRTDWTSAAQEMANLWDVQKKGSTGAVVTEAYGQIEKANGRYQDAVRNLADQVGRDFGESGIKGAIDNATEATESLEEQTESACSNGSDYVDELKRTVEELEQAWNDVKDAIEEAISAIERYLQLKYEAESSPAPSSPSTGGGGLPTGASSPTSDTSADTTTPKSGSDNDSSKGGGGGTPWAASEVKKKRSTSSGGNATGSKLIHKAQMYRASGGYTGEWAGSSTGTGIPAVLHEKEYVLNKEDTENFLSGIGMIRDMSKVNGSIERSILQSIANMAISTSKGLGSINTSSNNDNSTNNVFNITAEFPNANNVDDIRQAILTLPNIASQWVNRNTK